MHSKHNHKHLERYGVFAKPTQAPESPSAEAEKPPGEPVVHPVTREAAQAAIALLFQFEKQGGNVDALALELVGKNEIPSEPEATGLE